MMMVPADPAARDFAIDCFLADWRAGRLDRGEAQLLRAELRNIGDVRRLERVARVIDGRG
ncbi:hypothetical protein [Sphingomonas morindae]|uniref:Uncharacterized protein n=1 Tax=Sphingomonas morindae TaxID=1541170 RepID=A0ABY4XBP7_9SPHN|nr:hypothetical protein [Sphingomonas morindae]USI74379.1 hypothetical protein LHA26_08000 [Sphingomonas morindae]